MELLAKDGAHLETEGKHKKYRLSNGIAFVMAKEHGNTPTPRTAENELSLLKKLLAGKKPWER